VPIASLVRRLVPLAALTLTLTHVPQVGAGAFTRANAPVRGGLLPTTPMGAPRAAHTATRLPDGRVLVVGGFTAEEGAAEGAEIYDSATGRFTPLPRMRTLRHSHTATALPSGNVLIVGGYAAGSTTIAAAELFDPATNSFIATGSMRTPRAGHVAVLLGDGKVLVAGGVGPDWRFLSSAELYDPATGTFTPAHDMTVARESHTAVRLRDGRVLIAGGHRGRHAEITLHASAEAYDPAMGRFSRVGDMHVRRHKHDAVVLADGRVLVTGGADERDSDGVYDTTEWFDPASGTFTPGPSMQRPRYKHHGSAVLLPNGVVLIAGGAAQAETFDPRTRSFAIVSGDARLSGQFSAAAPLAGGQVLITGGYGNGRGPQASAWLYRP
jgi:hypothetical protein